MGVKLTVLADVQPPTVAFDMLAQLCGLKADGTELCTVLFTNNDEGRNLTWLLQLVFLFF